MEKAYKFRIYPNQYQQQLIQKTFGCCRFVYNYYLDKKMKIYQETKQNFRMNACSLDLTKLKQELEWLKEADACALQTELRNLEWAYENFFKLHYNLPNFKSKKHDRKSYTTKCNHGSIEVKGKHIKLPKLGWVKFRDKQVPQGRIVNAVVSQVPSGKYYVSLCCVDVAMTEPEKTGLAVGVDLGLKDFLITSDGDKIGNPKYLKQSLDKLAKLQRELSRKPSQSKRREKTRLKLARQYEKISNQRQDFLNKLSTKLVKDYDIICLENLKVQNMVKNHSVARTLLDTSWSTFKKKLSYKANWYGKTISIVDTFYPSSQTCSCCGYINKEVKNLKVREWICPECGAHHDRDVNAAINILQEGIKILQS